MAYSGPVPYGQAKVALVHPLADEVSIVWGFGTYSEPYTSRELAFFKNDQWVGVDIPELAQYSDGGNAYIVYPYVPIEELLAFLAVYALPFEPFSIEA